MEKEVEETASSLKQQETKLNTKIKEVEHLSNQLQNSDIANAEAQAIVQQQEKRIEKLLRKELNSKEELDHRYESLREKTRKIVEANEEIANLKEAITSLKEKTIEAKKQHEKSETYIAALCSELDRVKSELKILK
ncbi:unnamed protein product [Orchesella dallaii]|uniref:Uncharacterized protein n=1 Tax=Orchesella dallaii TaxID=48710 RepID=A0ABP1RHZ8_9HEXA